MISICSTRGNMFSNDWSSNIANISGADTLKGIEEHCADLGIDLSRLNCCGCDGTNTNTGRHTGVIALLEKKLGRQLQRCICCLHRIELPFRHYFINLDGVTSGPNSFTGPIGKLAGGCLHQMDVRKFAPLKCDSFEPLPEQVEKKLSWDQRVLYRHVVAVQTGTLSRSLAKTEIGPLCHARWITFQSRILRLFMSAGIAGNLLPKLRKLASYIISIYFPMHMNIKYQSSIVYGAVNLFTEVNLIRKNIRSKSEQNFILSNLQLNCYFAHPHNVLVAMLGDESFALRKEAIDMINDLRTVEASSLEYYLPKLNVNAARYPDLCKMEKVNGRWTYLTFLNSYADITEPPIIKGLDLNDFLASPFVSDLPCHTQSVERLVKVTTESSRSVCGRLNQSAEGMLVVKGRCS